MRKFFLGAALVAASFGMAQSADAATVMDVDGVSTVLAISDYEGTYIHLTQWGRHHYPVSKAAMPLKTLPVCNRRRGNKIIQTA